MDSLRNWKDYDEALVKRDSILLDLDFVANWSAELKTVNAPSGFHCRFCGTWISQISLDEAKKVVLRAFELGITYFDTAKLDGGSEEKIGAALRDARAGKHIDYFLATQKLISGLQVYLYI